MDKSKFKLSQPADVLTIGYQIFIMLTIVFHYSAVNNAYAFLIYHVIIILIVFWLPLAGDSKIITWIRAWSPVLIIPTNFTELHYLVHNISPIDFDNVLIHFDLELFGVHPTVWLENWSHPVLTEYLQWIYTTFYFLPMILGYILRRNKEYEKFEFMVFMMVLGFYVSYIGYFLVPAIGPRFTLDHLQTEPLTGVWITEAIRETLNYLENIQRDAFPSGHTAITLLTMLYARKYARSYYHILLVVGTSLIISTVYLRYHYVVDVIAGIVLTLIVYYLAPILYKKIIAAKRFYFRKKIPT